MSHYEFDWNHIEFKKVTTPVRNVIKAVLRFLVATLSLTIFYYAVFCFFISTDKEKRLIKENKTYKKSYAEMVRRSQLVGDVVEGLGVKDSEIYSEIFHTAAPSLFSLGGEDFLSQTDTVPDSDIVMYAAHKLENLEKSSQTVEDNFTAIMTKLGAKDFDLPPMSLPLENMSYAQTGASIGPRMNPYYKVETQHNGLDFIAPQGDAVIASASGVVSDLIRSRKGMGNVVEITHSGGYVTRYAHLGDMTVRKGQTVKKGQKIATVGISGNSFVPHLHYEVLKDGEVQDPVNYFFASVNPSEYAEILYMASSTGQSMD